MNRLSAQFSDLYSNIFFRILYWFDTLYWTYCILLYVSISFNNLLIISSVPPSSAQHATIAQWHDWTTAIWNCILYFYQLSISICRNPVHACFALTTALHMDFCLEGVHWATADGSQMNAFPCSCPPSSSSPVVQAGGEFTQGAPSLHLPPHV